MVFITAEIGINHNGDLVIAKKLIDNAKAAGCDAVKFQKRTVDKVYSKEVLDSPRESHWGTIIRDQKLGLEFGEKEYDVIDEYCKSRQIEWYASAWDIDSQIFLRKYDLKHNKVASAMLTHYNLLNTIAEEKKYTFISTGMSTEDANLRCIQTLQKEFNCNVGYSGHESSGYLICVVAVSLGATSIERHITLDRAMYGSDQASSLEIHGLFRLVSDIRQIDLILGDGVKRVLESEVPIMKKLRNF